jgi:hypothetical protein
MEEPKKGPGDPAAPAEPREPYEKPSVTWQDVLETRPGLTAGCGKVVISDAGCDTVQAS